MMSSSDTSIDYIIMDQVVKRPLSITRAVLEVNGMVRLTSEEASKGTYYSQGVGLARVNRGINCSSSCT